MLKVRYRDLDGNTKSERYANWMSKIRADKEKALADAEDAEMGVKIIRPLNLVRSHKPRGQGRFLTCAFCSGKNYYQC